MADRDTERMECMELWGGNQAVQRHFETSGLKIWIYSRPYMNATSGGDVYYLSSCASGRITRLLLADVSGHGEVVSQIAVKLRELMRRNVNYVRQTRLVRAMNQQFEELGAQGGFATALVATYFATTMTFSCSNAGHPVPLIFRRDSGQWSELTHGDEKRRHTTDTPLGVVDDAAYGKLDTKLQVGDLFLSFSDAVTESLDANGNQLGQAGILRIARDLDGQAPETIIPSLLERVSGLSAGNLDDDDTTILVAQATGAGPSFRENLMAPFRILRSVTDSTSLVSPT